MLYTKIAICSQRRTRLTSQDLRDIVSHFSDGLDGKELALLKNIMTDCEFTYDTLREMISEYRCVSPQVLRLLQLLFVIPATSATSERSFSAVRLVKRTFGLQ